MSKSNKTLESFLKKYLSDLFNSFEQIDINALEIASRKILQTIKKNNTIYVCGNGGSAAIANHYVCDYLKFLRQKTKLKPKIISLSNNIEIISAISNDISYDEIFKYQAESLFKKDDLLLIISSSGNSKNIIKVLKFAKKKGVCTIGFSGFEGGYLKKNSDISIHIPFKNYGIVEDAHHILMHLIMQSLTSRSKEL